MTTSISNRQLVDAYIRFRGFIRIEGDDQDLSCLLPLLLLDMQLQIFDTSISKIECRHGLKQARTRWSDCYNRFNQGSFLAFKNEYEDKIIELMDDLGDYISNNIMFLRVAVMDTVKDQVDTEGQTRLADAVICNTLARLALSWWGSTFKRKSVFKRFSYNPEVNRDIEGICENSMLFIQGYINDGLHYHGYINLNKNEAVVNATKSLDRKIAEWGRKASE